MNIAFIGAGKMATALAGGLRRVPEFASARITACDILPAARERFQAATGLSCAATAAELLGGADVVILAVKPQALEQTLAPLRGRLSGCLLVSIAAGITIAKLAAWSGSDRIVRVMPNTPAMVGRGAAGFACGSGATLADRELAGRLFSAVGMAAEVPEELLDAVTALSGSGPAYVFEMIQAMAEAGQALGLPAAMAGELALRTVAGAAAMVEAGLGTPEELRNAVTSPNGTTAAALRVMAGGRFRELIANAMLAARDRSRELSRG